jgi:minor extracellular serine protease Vpr
VTVTANAALPDDSLFGGYVVITPGGIGEAVHVPYFGLKGDYQSIAVLTPTANGFPWLAKLSGGLYFNQPAGATYTLQNGDLPYFLLHFDHQAASLLMEVFDVKTGKDWHRAFQDSYLPRNSTSTSFFALTWDGQTVNGKQINVVPNGQYVIKVTVLKALGNAATPGDTETWTSPAITVARP